MKTKAKFKMGQHQKNLLLSKMLIKGKRIKDLSKIMHMSHTAVQNKFNGKNTWNVDHMRLLIKQFDIQPLEAYEIFLK